MVLNLTIPEPGKKGRVKDIIIDILSFEWPLTLTKIHKKIKGSYNISISCQATYKAMLELLDEGVLTKQDKDYSINLDWISKLKEFSSQIEKNYKNSDKVPLMDGVLKVKTENNVTVMTFNSVLEMDKAWLNIKKDYYKNLSNEGDITFWEGNHCWWLLVYPEMEYAEIELIKKCKIKDFVIIHNNNPLDIEARKFYDPAGIKFKILDSKVDSDMTVFGDTIMQVYLPIEIKNQMESIYKKCKNPSEVDVHSFLKDVLTKKTQVNLVLTKNKDIADQLKRNVLKLFN